MKEVKDIDPVFDVLYGVTREVIECIKKHSRIYYILNHTPDNIDLDNIEDRKKFVEAFTNEYKSKVDEHLECFAAGMLTPFWRDYMAKDEDLEDSNITDEHKKKIENFFF